MQAPLAGGPSTPALAAAVSTAGGLGMLAAGYRTPEAVQAEVETVRAHTDRPFGVNLFAPPTDAVDDDAAIARYGQRLAEEARRQDAQVGSPRHDDDGWEDKLALVSDAGVPVVSFTFGCPRRTSSRACRRPAPPCG